MARRDRLKQGQDAKSRVMARLSSGVGAPSPSAPSRRIDRLKAPEVISELNVGIDRDVRSMAPELFDPFKQNEVNRTRFQPATRPLPSVEDQLRTATTAFTQESVKPEFRPTFGPPVPEEARVNQRQQAAKESPLSKIGEFAGRLAAGIVPGNFGSEKVERPVVDLSRIPDIPGVTTENPVTNFIRGAGDMATFGLSSYIDRMTGNVDAAEGATQTKAGKAGQYAGAFVLPAGKFKAGASLLSNVGRGLGAGAALGLGMETGEAATGRNDQTLGQRAIDVGVNTALGGAGVLAFAGLGKAAQAVLNKYRKPASQTLGLPAPRQRGNANTAEPTGTITPEYQFGLPEASPGSLSRKANAGQARSELKVIDDEIRQLNSSYERAIVDEYNYLKGSMGQKSQPGMTIKDPVTGEVTDRIGTISGNPKWYQEISNAANGYKKPSNKELYELARKRVDEGFQDEQGAVPSWKAQNSFDENMAALQEVRDTINQSLREIDPAINVTDTPIRSQELSFQRQAPEPRPSVAAAEPPAASGAAPTRLERLNAQEQPPAAPEAPAPTQARQEPQTQTPAPAVKQGWFERLFGTQAVGIVAGRQPGGRNTLTTEGQIVDKPIRDTIKGSKEVAKAGVRRMYQGFVDMNDPVKKISKEAYEASTDARRSSQLANVITTDKFVTPEGKVVGQGLQEIVRKAGRGNYNAFTDYLVARHAVTRMKRGERVYDEKLDMTVEKVEARVAELERRYPGFDAIGKEWDAYHKNIREYYGVNEDLLSRSLADHLEAENPNYASMRRQFSALEKIKGIKSFAQSSMFSGQKAPIKEVSPTGSTRKIVDPVRSAIEQTGAWVNAAMRNRVMKEIANKIAESPEDLQHIAEIVQPPKGSPNLKQLLDELGEEDYLQMLQDEFNELFRKSSLDKDNIVRAMVKGEPVYIKVHDVEAVKALVGMGSEQANLVLSIMKAFSDTVKRGATGTLAPLFAVKGATMDIGQALIQSENPIKHAGYLLGSVISAIADATPGLNRIPGLRNMAQDFYRTGGGYSSVLFGERSLKKSIGKFRQDPILHPRSIAKAAVSPFTGTYKAVIKVSDIAENMNRIAAFNYKLRQLGGQRTPENIREAMNYSREITTNYSRKGLHSQTLESIVPYSNAAIQGLYRFGKTWKEHPVKTTALVGAAVIAPKFYEYLQFSDDEDYQALPARVRYRSLIVGKNEDGTFDMVPMPPEYNALGALMVDALRAYKDGDPEAFKGVSDAMVNAFTPPLVSGALQGVTQGGGIEQGFWGALNSTSVGPVIGAAANKTFYGGPVESMKVTDRSPSQRFDERTTAPAKWLGENLKLSPMKIDYVLRAYGGDPARILLPLTSEVGGGTTRNTLLKNFIVDPVFTNNITNDFYDGKDLISQAYRDHEETGKPLPKWFSEDLRKLVTSQAKGSVSKRVSALYNDKRELSTDKSLTKEQRAQKIRDIQAQINDIFIDVNSQMRKAGVPILNR